MSFIDVALSKKRDASKVIITSATETSILIKDRKRFIIKHLLKGLAGLNSYKEAFKNEYKIGCRLKHSNILPYEELGEDENGEMFIKMASLNCIPLDVYLQDNPSFIANTEKMNQLIEDLMSAVSYMHQEGVCHFDLKPSNLLITASQKTIQIINPLSMYMDCKPLITFGNEAYVAPELLNDNGKPDERTDIYAIGKIIEFLFANATVPLAYKSAIAKATQVNQDKRFRSVEEMRQSIKRHSVLVKIGKKIMGLVAVFALFALLWVAISPDNEDTEFIVPPTSAQGLNSDASSEDNVLLPDTSLNNPIELTPEQIEQQKIYEAKAEEIFKKMFAKKADAELSKIYTSSNMNGDVANFKMQSTQRMQGLDQYQRELCETYSVDPILGAKLAAEVISNITQEKMKALEAEKKGDK